MKNYTCLQNIHDKMLIDSDGKVIHIAPDHQEAFTVGVEYEMDRDFVIEEDIVIVNDKRVLGAVVFSIQKDKPTNDCSKHLKEVAGISDMKVLAEMIGDLHYETLNKFLDLLSDKLHSDGNKDFEAGRPKLADKLRDAATYLSIASNDIFDAWEISKPFMNDKKP